MDCRKILPAGTILPFPGMECRIEKCIGRGSNAIVYEGIYYDVTSVSQMHHVLVKELFPYDAQGHIWRNPDNEICRDESGEENWLLHKRSFERGNEVHLDLLSQRPDQISGNINTFQWNNTYYTILDHTGSRSLDKEISEHGCKNLRTAVSRMAGILDSLETFHKRGYLHLDISADNILLIGQELQERVTLIDYNSVHTKEEINRGEELYFSAKEGFTAPEVLTGMYQAIGQSTDLFSVAAVFYACLTGSPPTNISMSRKKPPTAQESNLLKEAPSTVSAQVRKILLKGLNIIPDKRYQTCSEMKADFVELQNRLEGLGVTHASLWEAGRRVVLKYIKNNPALNYVERNDELYPLRMEWTESGEIVDPQGMIEKTCEIAGQPVLLTGAGGLGKSTALYRMVLSAPSVYSATSPALMYIQLSQWRTGESHFIIYSVLRELKFSSETRTMEDARHKLEELLEKTIVSKNVNRPILLLLLDGLNEVSGDPADLLKEIKELSQMPGIRIIISSRSVPNNFVSKHAQMVQLSGTEVDQQLSQNGLLLPESKDVQELLRTPLMLSIYIRSAKLSQKQLQIQTKDELLTAYFDTLLNIAQDGNTENGKDRWQIDAAMNLVLPAVASEIAKNGNHLNDSELFGTVEKCYKLFGSAIMRRAFPRWIGRSALICGEADNAEEWYGIIVHDILWKRLGLLLRDDQGRYQVFHQLIEDYLLDVDRDNRKLINKSRKKRIFLYSIIGALIIAFGTILFNQVIWPMIYRSGHRDDAISLIAYDYDKAKSVIENAAEAYCGVTEQYKGMLACLEERKDESKGTKGTIPIPYDYKYSLRVLDKMVEEGGEVIPWSRKKLETEYCKELIAMPQDLHDEYTKYIDIIDFISHDSYYQNYTEGFLDQLIELLYLDGMKANALYEVVCEPHMAGDEFSDLQENRKKHEIDLTALEPFVPQETVKLKEKMNLSDTGAMSAKDIIKMIKERREKVISSESFSKVLYSWDGE